jgi:hypothetical protein
MANISFKATLQERKWATDAKWNYEVPDRPVSTKTNAGSLVKSISFVSSATRENLELRFESAPQNGITRSEPLHHLMILNVNNFRLRETATAEAKQVQLAPMRESSEYVADS